MGGGRLAKKILYAQASSALMGNLTQINTEYRQACQALYQENNRATWADWLKAQAMKGDSEALNALRSRENAKGFKSRTVHGQAAQNGQSSSKASVKAPQRAAGTFGLGVSIPAANDAAATIDNITKQGTVIYRVGGTAVRDNGNGLQVASTSSPKAMQQALAFAAKHYGSQLSLTGDLLFKAQMVRAAVDGNLAVTFADPLLEKKRQELIEGQRHGQPRTAGQYRGRTGRATAHAKQSAVHTQGASRAATDQFSRASATATHQPNTGGFAAPPPPVARDRMRGLSERCLDGLKTGIEMLLPRYVPIFFQQSGSESDSLLRRGSAGIKTIFSDFVEQLKTDKKVQQQQAKPQGQQQDTGRSR